MKTASAFVGARGVDSLPYSSYGTPAHARLLRAAGIEFVAGYLGAVTPERLAFTLGAGLAFMPVTFAGEYFDGAVDELAQLKALAVPLGCTVWLDLEGRKSYDTPAVELCAKINSWADAIARAGYQPGLYVGSPQPLTSEELWGLHVTRYWNALSREADRYGKLAEPRCGWCMWQMSPSVMWAANGVSTGVLVDANMVGQDFLGRLPSWVVT